MLLVVSVPAPPARTHFATPCPLGAHPQPGRDRPPGRRRHSLFFLHFLPRPLPGQLLLLLAGHLARKVPVAVVRGGGRGGGRRGGGGGGALSLPVQGHAVLGGLVAALAVCAGLRDHGAVRAQLLPDEALVSRQVSPLRVGIDQPTLCPGAEAAILALLVDLGLVAAAEDVVEHNLRVVAVCVAARAEPLGVREDPGPLPRQRAVRQLVREPVAHPPPLGQPLGRAEVVRVAQGGVSAGALAQT